MSRPVGVKETHKRRPGGGRKPKLATLLKRKITADKIGAAEMAFTYLVNVVTNEAVPTPVRVDAANLVLNRVMGRPVEMPVTSEDQKRYEAYHEKLDNFIKGTGAKVSAQPAEHQSSNGHNSNGHSQSAN